MRKLLSFLFFLGLNAVSFAQVPKTMLRLPDTGQNQSYTNTFGEDADFNMNVPFFIKGTNGTVIDTITGLMWQQDDGGEMTYENAILYADTLTFGGFSDWRLPSTHEAFSILNHQKSNPALDINVFTTSTAEYWWTSNTQMDNTSKVWVTNAGGGIGNHPKTETISAGGTKRFHARLVRNNVSPDILDAVFNDKANGIVLDLMTGLEWQKNPLVMQLTWEQALVYADTCTFAGKSDWRLPNIKELQSISKVQFKYPSIPSFFIGNIQIGKYWSSTTLPNSTNSAWYLQTQFGITSYDAKTLSNYAILVRNPDVPATGFLDNNLEQKFVVFPNPNAGNFTLKLPETLLHQNIQIKIFNALGEMIQEENLIVMEECIPLTLSYKLNGIYSLVIDSEHAQFRTKFILNQ